MTAATTLSPRIVHLPSHLQYFFEWSWNLPKAYQNGAPTEWTCPNDYFEAWDGICDCNCGAWDPDCGTVWNPAQEVRGCGEGHFCSLAGTCMYGVDTIDIYYQSMDAMMSMTPSPGTVVVSYDCGFLKFPGTYIDDQWRLP